MQDKLPVTYLFSDIEGSTRLWENDPQLAAPSLAWHDALARRTVERHGGTVVKMTGDGLHAAFHDPAAALAAVVDFQTALARPVDGVAPLKVRCGLHMGSDQRRDNDFYGPAVNRAARIMSAAHGGQILLSEAVAERVAEMLPSGVSLRALGTVRLKDLASPERVYQVVHPALRSDFPALRSLADAPNNLPQQLNSFVGRDRELSEVRALLARHRLVTLVAMGGVGKSRLSIQLGAEVLEDFPDGVWLVELAPLADAADVPQAAAAVLGVKEDAGGGVVDALKRFAADRRLLIILDNCEHVVRGAAELAKGLLQAGGGVKVLATSRDPLQTAGECAYHLDTLAVPRADDLPPEQLAQHAAVRLFLDRVEAVQPAFRLTPRLVAPVTEICRRLDGIALALELAAARTRSMTVEEIARRLDQRFRLLATGDTTVLPRQRTLRALIDWSHDLLNEAERAAFRRLAVFAGGWTLDAAEAVIVGEGIEPACAFEVLAGLVEKSLVAMEAESGRYRMLDTVRHYALERLRASEDHAPTQRRHCLWFVQFAEQARAALGTADQAERLRLLDADRENAFAAFSASGAIEGGDELALRLMQALRFYLIHRGMPSAVLAMCNDLLGRPALAEPRKRWRLLFGAGQACAFMARHAEAIRYLDESLRIARALQDQALVGETLQPLGAALVGEGRYADARACLDEAVELARASANDYEVLAALTARAMLHRLEGELDAAERGYSAALQIARASNDPESTAMLLINLAMTGILRGRWRATRALLEEVDEIATASGSLAVAQSLVETCAGRAAVAGEAATAACLFGFAEAQATRTGLRRDAADEDFLMRCLAPVRASPRFDDAVRQGRSFSLDDALRAARASLAA